MATLERKKKPTTVVQNDEPKVTEADFNDLTSDPVLEDLSKEPMEYSLNESCSLSEEVVQSLQSVKHICLNVLDVLLLQIVRDLPRNRQRRLSDCSTSQGDKESTGNVLGSITQKTNLLQELSSVATTTMTRSKSSPPATSISDVYRILDSNHQRHQNNGIGNQDYTLCCSLAALLNDVYRLLELDSSTQQQQQEQQQEVISTDSESDVSLLQQQLRDKVSNFQRQRAAGKMIMDDASEEMKLIWDEINHLMNIVCGLVANHPPTYEDISSMHGGEKDEEAPPAYDSVQHNNINLEEKKKFSSPTLVNQNHDLDELLSAIDRLSHVAPRLNNQRVDLSERQANELAAATLGKTVERLSRGRMEDQRAILPLKSKQEVLQDLIQQIHRSASRSLDNQRVSLSSTQRRDMEFASIHGVIKRLDRGRYTDQEWISHEEFLINDLTHTTNLLVKSLNRPTYNRQRFSMSAAKERSLFISGLFTKVESLEGYRLADQDANIPEKKVCEDEDLHQLLNHIYNSSKPQLDNQRASFT